MLLNNSTSIDHTVLQSLTALFSFLLEMDLCNSPEISSKAVNPSQIEVIGCILHTTSML